MLLFSDPGTLMELGYAKAKGLPVILWDPYGRADNVWLQMLPDAVVGELDDVIQEVFLAASKT